MGCVLRAYTTLHNSSQQVMTGTSDLLTTSWTAVQQLVEELRDPILKVKHP